METASPVHGPSGYLREEVLATVKEIVASIKMIPEGGPAIANDAQLFNDGLSEPSPLELDSLDALDLALALKERYDPEGGRFEAFLNGEVELQSLGTVAKITDYVLSLATPSTGGQLFVNATPADERVPTTHQ